MCVTFQYLKRYVDTIPVTLSYEDKDEAIKIFNEFVLHPDTKWARITDDENGTLIRHFRSNKYDRVPG